MSDELHSAEKDVPGRLLDPVRDMFWTLRRLVCVVRWHADKRPHTRLCGYIIPPGEGNT